MIATIVEWDLLGEAVYTSVIVGLGVLLIAALAVVSSLRAQDVSGSQRTLYGVATGACVLALAGIIAAGIWTLTQ